MSMKMNRLLAFLLLALCVPATSLSADETDTVSLLKQKFDAYVSRRYPRGIAETLNNSYFSEPFLAGLLSMYEATQDVSYLRQALEGVEHLISLMDDLNADGYQEWRQPYCMNSAVFTYETGVERCSCVDAERGVRQFARLARLVKNDPSLDPVYGERADAIVRVVEHDIVQHPDCTGQETPSLDRFAATFTNGGAPVYHILSHAALILTELYLITGNLDYLTVAHERAAALQRGLFPRPRLPDPSVLAWGTTLCTTLESTYPDCYYVKGSHPTQHPPCRDPSGHRWCSPPDVSHAENFVFAAIELYRAGIVFTKEDIDSLAHTFLSTIWDGNASDPRYYDFIDGRLEPPDPNDCPDPQNPQQTIACGSYGPWKMGSNLAPGWVSLGAFHDEVTKVVMAGDESPITNKDWTNRLAYYGELARNVVAGECRYTNRAREVLDRVDNDCDGAIDEGVPVPPKQPPMAPDQTLVTLEDQPVAIRLTASDPEGDPLTFAVVGQPAQGLLSGAAPYLTYTPAADYRGADQFTWTVSDGALTSTPATVSITIVQAAPMLVSSSWASGFIDPRQDQQPSGVPQGIRAMLLTFDRSVVDPASHGAIGPSNFLVRQTGLQAPPVVTAVHSLPFNPSVGSRYFLRLDRPLTPGECTTIIPLVANTDGVPMTAIPANRVALGFLPGDVNQDGTSDERDVQAWVQALPAGTDPVRWRYVDLNRDGAVNPADLQRLQQLLNGAGTSRSWTGVSLPACRESP